MGKLRTCPICKGTGKAHLDNPQITMPCNGCGGRGKLLVDNPYGPSRTCFPADTLIQTPTGQRPICGLETGESVCAFDGERNAIVAKRILRTYQYRAQSLCEIVLSDRKNLRTTGHHSLRVDDGWRRASLIHEGDRVFVIDSDARLVPRLVTSSRALNECVPVYNLIVEDEFNFIADGCLVHCFTFARALRVRMWSALSSVGSTVWDARFYPGRV